MNWCQTIVSKVLILTLLWIIYSIKIDVSACDPSKGTARIRINVFVNLVTRSKKCYSGHLKLLYQDVTITKFRLVFELQVRQLLVWEEGPLCLELDWLFKYEHFQTEVRDKNYRKRFLLSKELQTWEHRYHRFKTLQDYIIKQTIFTRYWIRLLT